MFCDMNSLKYSSDCPFQTGTCNEKLCVWITTLFKRGAAL